MKLQKQELANSDENHPFFTFTIERIHIKVKFACRLYLEYQYHGESRKSREIRIDQKASLYQIDEPIEWQSSGVVSSNKNEEDELVIYVKLLSNKGLAFTAGVITVNTQNYKTFPQHFTLKLTKSLDFDAYCECARKELPKDTNNKDSGNIENIKKTPSSIKKRDSNMSSEQEKGKLSREPSAIRTQIERQESSKSLLHNRMGSWVSQRKIRRTQSLQDYRLRQKELMQKIEDLQSEIHKNSVLFDRQREIISLLQIKQREFNEERTQFKSQIKLLELDIEDKRQKIRELQGQKLKLLMNTLQAEKELATSKQKIGSLMEKVYQRIKRLFNQKSQKVFAQYTQKSPQSDKVKDSLKISLSKISPKNGQPKCVNRQSKQKDASELSKMAFSAVRGLINKEVDQAWLEESLGCPQNNPSSVLSNTLNDMSISNINGKTKEVSLLNSELFLKPTQTEMPSWSPSNAKNFIEEISKSLVKLENMITTKVQRTIQSFVEILEKSRGGKDTSGTEESLLGYLEQLQTGFERQIGVLSQKDRVIVYYEQLIQELNQKLSEKQNLVVQLEEQLFRIEEEKDHIKGELHDVNYAHSLKQEELMKKIHILQHGKIMPDYSSSASPTHKPQARRKDPKVPHAAYQQEIIQYKEHLRMMEIDLLHERDERQKLAHSLHAKQLELQQALIEKRRLQFAAKIRERMASLNQSIQFSNQEQEDPPKNQQKFTQESLGQEQDFVNILIYQQ